MFFDALQKPTHDRFSAEASLINTAGLLLHSHHAGKDVSFARAVALGDLTRLVDISEYSGVHVSSAGTQLPRDGYSGQTASISPSLSTTAASSPTLVYSFTPSAYGTVTGITLTMDNSYDVAGTDYVTVYSGGVLVAESVHRLNSGNTQTYDFTINFEADPNKTYELYFSTDINVYRWINTIAIAATPVIASSGWVLSKQLALPSYATRIALNVYTSGNAPDVMVKLGDGSFESVVEKLSKQAVSQTGAACTARRYEYEFLPGTYESITIKIEMNAADIVVYGFFGAIL